MAHTDTDNTMDVTDTLRTSWNTDNAKEKARGNEAPDGRNFNGKTEGTPLLTGRKDSTY